MTTVMVFGTFDLLHPGHLFLFSEAKRYGDRLVAVVARDATVQKMKHHAPMHDEQARLAAVRATAGVDEAVLGDAQDYYAVLDAVRPDVICLGYDQHSSISVRLQDELAARGLRAIIIHLPAFHPEKYKSSVIRKNTRPA